MGGIDFSYAIADAEYVFTLVMVVGCGLWSICRGSRSEDSHLILPRDVLNIEERLPPASFDLRQLISIKQKQQSNNTMAHLRRVEAPLRYLTKSLVKTALSCPRKLVYATNPDTYAHKFDLEGDPLRQHLSNEGERFGDYCKRLFPLGVEIGKDASFERRNNAPMSEAGLIDETKRLLMGEEPIVLFEGAVHHDLLFARPDVLVKTADENNNQTELKIIEVKSKSWDSRHTVESKMLTLKKSISSTFLPYIQDIAFQTLVLRRAFPDFRISS